MSDTKRKMAQALKELMAEKPLKRITIQDIVERSHMTRQSFYYHFQDIYEVLELICRYDLVDQIAYREEESFAHWMERLMEIVETNKWFYRKMLQDMDWERVAGYLKPAVEAQIRRLVSGMLTEQETRSLSGAADRFPHSLCDSVHLPLHFQPEGSEGAECRQSPGTASNLLAALRQVQLFV